MLAWSWNEEVVILSKGVMMSSKNGGLAERGKLEQGEVARA
jgi:hypothetical protein